MSVGDRIEYLIEKALEVHTEIVQAGTNFANLEKQFDKLEKRIDESNRNVLKEIEDLQRRINKLEATLDATFQASLKEGIVHALERYVEKHGELPKNVDATYILGSQAPIQP